MTADGHSGQRPPRFEAVAFDCDGVLADTDLPWAEAEQAVLEAHGGRMTPAIRVAAHGLDPDGTVELLAAALPGPIHRPTLRRMLLDEAAARIAGSPAALPGAVEVVTEATRRWPVAVVSNTPAEVLRPLLKAIGILDLVHAVIAADQVTAPKPAAEPYLEAARRLDVAPQRMLVVEDSPIGVAAARAAGCPVVGVLAPGRPHLAETDLITPDLFELLRLVVLDPEVGARAPGR